MICNASGSYIVAASIFAASDGTSPATIKPSMIKLPGDRVNVSNDISKSTTPCRPQTAHRLKWHDVIDYLMAEHEPPP